MTHAHRHHGPRGRRAFSLVEALLCSLVVATMLAAALQVAGLSVKVGAAAATTSRGAVLAQELLAEVMSRPYEADGEFGPSEEETKEGHRGSFDDVDDYDGWKAQPPQTADGKVLTGHGAFMRTVHVEHVDTVKPESATNVETGIVRITVTVYHHEKQVAKVVALRTAAADVAREVSE